MSPESQQIKTHFQITIEANNWLKVYIRLFFYFFYTYTRYIGSLRCLIKVLKYFLFLFHHSSPGHGRSHYRNANCSSRKPWEIGIALNLGAHNESGVHYLSAMGVRFSVSIIYIHGVLNCIAFVQPFSFFFSIVLLSSACLLANVVYNVSGLANRLACFAIVEWHPNRLIVWQMNFISIWLAMVE